jgi:hypothetical protein
VYYILIFNINLISNFIFIIFFLFILYIFLFKILILNNKKFISIATGKHEEQKDEHGTISRQFVRKYMIPEQCNIDEVSSSLSSDGVLSIVAPRKEQAPPRNEKSIKIEHTGKPAVQNKQASNEKKNSNGKCEIKKN